MKTAISLPDGIFEKAELLAEQLGVSRSALYSAALESYMQQREDEAVTRQLNKVYADSELSDADTLDSLAKHSMPLYDKW